jgi:hypothetical protein
MNPHIPSRAPAHTPSPLREVYDLVADAVGVACGFRQEMAESERHATDFKAAAQALADTRHRANVALWDIEIWLRSSAAGVWEACRAALEGIEPINHACSHVLLSFGMNARDHTGWDFRACPESGSCCKFSGDTRDYFAAVPSVDERSLLESMRRETIAAAARLTSVPPPIPGAATPPQYDAPSAGGHLEQLLSAVRAWPSRPFDSQTPEAYGGLIQLHFEACSSATVGQHPTPPPLELAGLALRVPISVGKFQAWQPVQDENSGAWYGWVREVERLLGVGRDGGATVMASSASQLAEAPPPPASAVFSSLDSDYERLKTRLIDLLNGDVPSVPRKDDPERNEGRIAVAVHEATGMTPEHWEKLDGARRESWLEKTIAALDGGPHPEKATLVVVPPVIKTEEQRQGRSGRALKKPHESAISVYRYWLLTGKKQEELAADPQLMKQLRRTVTQGTISRWLKRVAKWIEAGNVLPPLPDTPDLKPPPIDPGLIDQGQRRDGRAKHQRGRRNADNDD